MMKPISAFAVAALLVALNIPIPQHPTEKHVRTLASLQDETVSSADEWATLFQDRVRTFSCHYASQILVDLKERGGDIDGDIQSELDWLNTAIENRDLNREERQLLKSQRNVLRDLQKVNNRSEDVQHFYESFCETNQHALGGVAKGTAHVLHGVGLTATFPLRFMYAFARGIVKGDVRPEKRLSLYEAIGSQQYRSIATYALWKGAKLMWAGSTSAALWTIPAFAVPFSDLLVSQICETPNSANEREVKFCEHYKKWGNPFLKGVIAGEKAGVSIHSLFDKKTDEEARATTSNEPISDQNLCRILQNEKAKPKHTWSQTLDTMGLVINPGRFAPIADVNANTDSEHLYEMPRPLRGTLRNVIVTMGPSEHDMELYQNNNEEDQYKQLQKNLSKMQKQLRRLYRSKSEETCIKRKEKSGFEWTRYVELQKSKSEMRRAEIVQQDAMAQKLIKRARGLLKRSLHLDWEVIPTNDIMVIHDLLRSPSVGNLVIVTHSFENGKIVDAQLTTIPNRFFAEISPSLMSLTFYACHGPNIVDAFYLKDKFFSIPTYHAQKHIFTIGPNEVMGKKDVTPLLALGEYIDRLDEILYRSIEGNLLVQTLNFDRLPELAESERCSIDIGHPAVTSGTLAVIVNRRFVGSLRADDTEHAFDFPCSHLDRTENIVLIQNIHATEVLGLDEKGIEIRIAHPNARYLTRKVEPFYVEGRFSSEKVTVVKE